MFTVVHQHPDGTKEYHADVPNPKFVPAKDGEAAYVELDGWRLTTGKVFVMNAEGATVGTFRLDR